ncbi:MAG TPA: DUF2203 domain-containing protein [Thermoplasmata archaeon]|nr:DUF2203 domain-containing protein [Thermoplasmata archaeon]
MPKDTDLSEPPLPQPGHIWTVDEANRRLDGIRETLPRLRAWVVRLRAVHDELHRLSAFWGKELEAPDNPDREMRDRLTEEWQKLTQRLEGEVHGLQAEGIEIKDLESGLIDFYALINGEVVFLCWQRGEDSVEFYHTLDGGYRSRRPLRESGAHRSGDGPEPVGRRRA